MNVDAHHDTKPNRVHELARGDLHLEQDGRHNRHHDEDNLEEIEKEAHDEHHRHDQNYSGQRSARQGLQELFYDLVSAEDRETPVKTRWRR